MAHARRRAGSSVRAAAALGALLWALALAACGGGGGDRKAPEPVDDITGLTLHGDPQAVTGQAVGIVATVPDAYTRFQWTQLAGPDVALLTPRSAAIGFEAPEQGVYRFSLTARTDGGAGLSDTFEITVSDGAPPAGALRRDRALSARGQTSLRFWVDGALNPRNIRFRQIQGPAADFAYGSDPRLLYLTAPTVPGDRVLVIEASADTDAGPVSDRAYLVVQNRAAGNSPYFCDGANGRLCATNRSLGALHPYLAASPYANALQQCVFSNRLTAATLCSVATLPPLGLDTDLPSVDQVMGRVLVSQDWMGRRFRDFLTEQDPHGDFRRLLRATTAVVLSDDIRPSFYWSLTGAIYLDPDKLWLTADERDLINERPDARGDFGTTMQFDVFVRYLRGTHLATPTANRLARASREPDDLIAPLGALLYHELAHANDDLPPGTLDQLDPLRPLYSQIDRDRTVSSELYATQGRDLDADITALAQIFYAGLDPTDAQQATTPETFADRFFNDEANDFYNYSTRDEDVAMLFEETMMGLRYQLDTDLAVVRAPAANNGDTRYPVVQGQRNRVGDDAIAPFADYLVSRLLPEAAADASAHLAALDPEPLCTGLPFNDTRGPDCDDAVVSAARSFNGGQEEVQRRRYYSPPEP
tara:strand:- start:5965 stop:7902 length:1938 start_codon:yes stop_codon:yes gene_type:complete